MGNCFGGKAKDRSPQTPIQTNVLTVESEAPAPVKVTNSIKEEKPETSVREKGDSFVLEAKHQEKLVPAEPPPETEGGGLQVTKGKSFAFQEGQDPTKKLSGDAQEIQEFLEEGMEGLGLSEGEDEEESEVNVEPVVAKVDEPKESTDVPPQNKIEPAKLDEEELEENWDHPTYAKMDRSYKLGDEIIYAPELSKPVSFRLHLNKESSLKPTVKITYAYKSLAGKSANGLGPAIDKPNQDSVAIVRTKKYPERAIFGVFDGHGPFGEHASHFCRKEILKMYRIAMRQHPDDAPEKLLHHTLRYLHRKFGETKGKYKKGIVDPIVSGTTAIVVLLDGDRIITANVGDSRAILATKIDDENFKVDQLSEDHKPERPDERERILQSKARLLDEETLRGVRSGRVNANGAETASPDKEENKGKVYICRVLPSGEIVYGVLFTRSIGDMDAHRNLGVSADPEFVQTSIDDKVNSGKEQAIILASDGVWDMMTNEECAAIALTNPDPKVASEEIVKRCSYRWGMSGEGRRDDITCCVVGIGNKFEDSTKDNAI
eukprot:snap_masked-scaffold_1-processed-gene-5.2-mRNA-1 protein AED:0.21 eAED:0.28 QI:0/-1/0/1/-1/1/1/0/546